MALSAEQARHTENVFHIALIAGTLFIQYMSNDENPGKSFGLIFIPNKSDLFRIIPKYASRPIRTHQSQPKKSLQSRLM